MKKLEIEKTKPTFIISVLKVDIIKVGLVFSISNFFIAKTSLANNWRSFSSSYLSLVNFNMPAINKLLWPKPSKIDTNCFSLSNNCGLHKCGTIENQCQKTLGIFEIKIQSMADAGNWPS